MEQRSRAGIPCQKHKAEPRYDIPPAMAREIGRFSVTWAHFEDYLQGIVGNTIDLSIGERRLLLRAASTNRSNNGKKRKRQGGVFGQRPRFAK